MGSSVSQAVGSPHTHTDAGHWGHSIKLFERRHCKQVPHTFVSQTGVTTADDIKEHWGVNRHLPSGPESRKATLVGLSVCDRSLTYPLWKLLGGRLWGL